jgi:hypothetical protein
MAEATRLMIDVVGGFMTDLPSDRDFKNFKIGGLSHAAHRFTIFMESGIHDKKNRANCLAEE